MNFFNRNRQRSPVDSVRVLKDYIQRLDAGSVDQRKKVSLDVPARAATVEHSWNVAPYGSPFHTAQLLLTVRRQRKSALA